jgi:hypothetical protein
MKREKTKPRPIGEILGKASRDLRIDENIRRYGLWEKWSNIVGSEIAAHARPHRWQGHVLVVRVEHPAWIQELSYLKPQIMEKIQSAHIQSKLVDMRFEVGTLPKSPEQVLAEEAPILRPLDAEEEELVKRVTAEIDDPDIREAAAKAMRRSMAVKKR